MVKLYLKALLGALALTIVNPAATLAAQVDPTAPPFAVRGAGKASASPTGKAAKLKLQQIVHQGDDALAVINNKTLRVGERIGAYRVTAIRARQVELRSSTRRLTLQIFPAQIKQ